jgi:hypothetical protein
VIPTAAGFCRRHSARVLIPSSVEIRRKAINTALCLTSGAYQTSLVSYFTHRDLFPSLMKVCYIPGPSEKHSVAYMPCDPSAPFFFPWLLWGEPTILQYIQDAERPELAFEPFLLLGMLTNYNKFEYRNPYRLRLEDFVNESIIQKICQGLGCTCSRARDQYGAIIDDTPDTSWSLGNTLSYIGLGVLAPIKAINPMAATEDSKEKFAVL